MNLLFVFRKSRQKKCDLGTLYGRITVNNEQCPPFSTGIRLNKKEWDNKNQRVLNNDPLNTKLKNITTKLDTIQLELESKNKPVSAKTLLNIYKGKTKVAPTLLDCYQKYIEHLKRLVKIGDRSDSTRQKEEFRYKNVKLFLSESKISNIEAENFTIKIARQFELWAKEKRMGNNDHIQKHLQALKRVLEYACECEIVSTNKLNSLKCTFSKPKEIVFLDSEQTKILVNHKFTSERLQKVADLFIFQCYTGLDYGDCQSFNILEHLIIDSKGRKWIHKRRNKGGVEAIIPLMMAAEQILNKYGSIDLLNRDIVLLPVISNQKYNCFIKEISAELKFRQYLTSHVARKTFGMLMLNEGFSIESVSKMLGHSNIKVTQNHYANVIKRRLENEVTLLWDKINIMVA